MNTPFLSYQERITRVLLHIENHMDDPPGLEDLARIACFSPFHFHRIFRAMTGESVAAYVRRLQLERAAQRLSYSRQSVTDIALAAGYDSVDAFTRAFRSCFGASPSDYRKAGGSAFEARIRSGGTEIFYHRTPEVAHVNVQIKKFSPITVAAMRHVGPYMECGTSWERFMGALAAHGIDPTQFRSAYSICHDDPDVTPPNKCRMELCVPLPAGLTSGSPEIAKLVGGTEVYLRTLGGDEDYAAVLIKGPYELLHPAYRSLYGEWLPQSGREPDAAPGFEAYLNCPETTAPEDLLTEIYIPLKAV